MTVGPTLANRIGQLVPHQVRPVVRQAYYAVRETLAWLRECGRNAAGWPGQFIRWVKAWFSEPPANWAARRALGALVCSVTGPRSFDTAYVGETGDLAPLPPFNARVFRLTDPSGAGSGFYIRLPAEARRRRVPALVVYATAGVLSTWDRLEADLDELLAAYRRVAIVLIADKLQPLTVASHSYMLSILLSGIPWRKFEFDLDVYVAGLVPPRKTFVTEFCSFYLRSAVDGVRRRLSRGAETPSPDRFSALVISVAARGSA